MTHPERESTLAEQGNEIRYARAVVIRTPAGHFGAQLLDGPDEGRWWALAGTWAPGQSIQVRYYPADQFADPV